MESIRNLQRRLSSYGYWYGADDPRTRKVERDLTAARLAAAEAEVARLKAQLDAMPVAS